MTRTLDFLLSLLAILVLLPLLLPIMLALKLTGEHDVFYRQKRIGRGAKPFFVLKFATMLRNSPNLPGGVLTQKSDPRILPMGRFLRKTKINELPQLWNILIGEMSFVGPRPQAPAHYDLYSDEVKTAIDQVRPGLTGIGSIVFRDEESLLDRVSGDRDHFHDHVITPYKGQLELWFTTHQSLSTYFTILFLTAWVILFPSSNFPWKIFKTLPTPSEELLHVFTV